MCRCRRRVGLVLTHLALYFGADAGDDISSRSIYEAWQSLVGGAAVDERREELKAQQALAEGAARKNSASEPAAASGGLLDAAEAPGLHGEPVTRAMAFDSDSEDEY